MADTSKRATPEIHDKYSFLAYKSNSLNHSATQENDSISAKPTEEENLKITLQQADSEVDFSYEERVELLLQTQTSYLASIRNMLMFFVILACLGLVIGVIAVVLSIILSLS